MFATYAVCGFLGGLVRGLVGITKSAAVSPKEFVLSWRYFIFTLFVSGVVGIMAGVLSDGDWKLALLAGYAGTDFIENLYRLKFSRLFKK